MICGRVAQLDRALASEAKGREFESHLAHHRKIKGLRQETVTLFADLEKIPTRIPTLQGYFRPITEKNIQ